MQKSLGTLSGLWVAQPRPAPAPPPSNRAFGALALNLPLCSRLEPFTELVTVPLDVASGCSTPPTNEQLPHPILLQPQP